MKCKQIRAIADLISAGDALPGEEEAARRHAIVCDECALTLSRADALRELIDIANEPVAAPDDMVAAVRERILEAQLQPRILGGLSRAWRGPVLRGAAYAAAGFAFLWMIYRPVGVNITTQSVQTTVPAADTVLVDATLDDAIEWNSADALFADNGVVEVGRARDVATACLDW